MSHYPLKSKGFWGGVLLLMAGIVALYFGDSKTAIYLIGTGLGILGIRDKLERDL